MRVAINGLGRIGRAVFKIVLDAPDMEPVAVNDLISPDNLAYLLNYDTVYGRYGKKVTGDGDHLNVDGVSIPALQVKDPGELPWSGMNIHTVFECTGIFTKRPDLEKHIQAGARRAILSAPAKSEDVPTVVYKVNTPQDGRGQIVSCASCTTNATAPVFEVMARHLGVSKAMMTTIHAYTSTQGIVDGPSKKLRRGRAAAANMVPTTTGAAVAVTKTLPEYRGKFDGVAVRIPLPIGSVADITFLTEKDTSVDEVNRLFREEAESDRYRGVMAVTEDEIVSSDIIQDPHAAVVDLSMTNVVDGNLVKVMSWYDNEWGYANQMVREARREAG